MNKTKKIIVINDDKIIDPIFLNLELTFLNKKYIKGNTNSNCKIIPIYHKCMNGELICLAK